PTGVSLLVFRLFGCVSGDEIGSDSCVVSGDILTILLLNRPETARHRPPPRERHGLHRLISDYRQIVCSGKGPDEVERGSIIEFFPLSCPSPLAPCPLRIVILVLSRLFADGHIK